MNLRTSFIFVFLVACSTFGSDDAPPGPAGANEDGGAPGNGQPPVTGTPGRGLSVVPSSERAFIIQGESLEIPLRITRKDSTTDAVAIAVAGLPAGVTVAPLVIASGATEGKLKVTVPATTPQASVDLSIFARAGDGSTATGALPIFVRGAPGAIDTTFAPGGLLVSETIEPPAPSGGTLTLLADGSMVVAATGGRIVKVDAEGKTLASTDAGVGRHLVPLPDGRFLNFGADKLVRFSARLEPDTSLNGGTGLVTDNVQSVAAVAAAGGKAFALGVAANGYAMAVKRFSADGVLESESCSITSPSLSLTVGGYSLNVDASGGARVVGGVGGGGVNGGPAQNFLYGCAPSGTVNLGGSIGTPQEVRFGLSDPLRPPQITDDGAAGFFVIQFASGGIGAWQLLHLDASGAVDRGPFTTDLIRGVTVLRRASDGSVVIASDTGPASEVVALRRYKANGAEDSTFVHAETATSSLRPYGMVFQNGRIVVLASTAPLLKTGMLVLGRYWG